MNSFLLPAELNEIGFKEIGENVLVSRKASIYSPENIVLGNNVRIDDFCILSGKITLGSFIHISAYCALYGQNGIELGDYTGLSPRTTVFSATDDFNGDYLIGPMVKKQFTKVLGGKVTIKKYSQIGAGCIILPDIVINEGVAVGSMSLINKSLPEWTICYGIPACVKKQRRKGLLNFV